jgi:hypothetical protein
MTNLKQFFQNQHKQNPELDSKPKMTIDEKYAYWKNGKIEIPKEVFQKLLAQHSLTNETTNTETELDVH